MIGPKQPTSPEDTKTKSTKQTSLNVELRASPFAMKKWSQ
jgi:hypothetical protein